MKEKATMGHVTTGQRVYLAAVGFLGLWVGVACYFDPALSDWGIPWQLPPLCATFLGSFYLSGAAGLSVCIFSRRWLEIRAVLPMIAIWTGGLTIVSLFYLSAFDFHKTQVWVWWGAYIIYPLIALSLLWRHRAQAPTHPSSEPALPRWVKTYLIAQGIGMIGLSLLLLFATGWMQSIWPWKTGMMMLQLYSQPFLAYGAGSLILARQAAWSEIRANVMAMTVFAGAELIASVRFLSFFDGAPLAITIWFVCASLMTAMLSMATTLAIRAIWRDRRRAGAIGFNLRLEVE